MTLQSSGAISLDNIHVEAGGTTGTSVSINDSDVRGLIGASASSSMNFTEWYSASAITFVADLNAQTTITVSQNIYEATTFKYYGFFGNQGQGSVSPTTVGTNSLRLTGFSNSGIYRRESKISGSFDAATSDFVLHIGSNAAGTHVPADTYITGVTIDMNGGTKTLSLADATTTSFNATLKYRLWIWDQSVFTLQELTDFSTVWDGSGDVSVVLNT